MGGTHAARPGVASVPDRHRRWLHTRWGYLCLVKIAVRTLAVIACTLSALAGCNSPVEPSGQAAPPVDRETSEAKTFDPLQFDEPEQPPVPKGQPSEAQMLEGLRYAADAYSYGLRTGFRPPDLRSMGCGCFLVSELDALAADGLHAVMDPVDLKVVAHSPVKRLDGDNWTITVRAQFVVPKAVYEDANGAEVRREPAVTKAVELVLNVDTGRFGDWYFRWWDDTSDSGA